MTETLSSLQNHSSSYLYEPNKSFCVPKWVATALLVSSLVLFSAIAAFGSMGLFTSSTALPQWLAPAVGTIGHSGCWALFAGSCLGFIASIIGLVLFVRSCQAKQNIPLTLQEALQKSDVQALKAILQANPDAVNTVNAAGETPLIYAAQLNNLAMIKPILDCENVDVNAAKPNGYTAIHEAARCGSIDVLKFMLDDPQSRFDPNAKGNFGATPLMEAAVNNQVEAFTFLLNHPKVDIRAKDDHGMNVSRYTTSSGPIRDLLREKIAIIRGSKNSSSFSE